MQITETSIPTLEDHIEGMEYESHYGDMRTEIQEVRLKARTATTAVYLTGQQSTVLPESFPACNTDDLLRLSKFISNASVCYDRIAAKLCMSGLSRQGLGIFVPRVLHKFLNLKSLSGPVSICRKM